jgi:cytochrome c peroxidase
MLGKILFWDEQMGELDTMACGTCHRAAAGGSDPRASMAGAMQPGPNGTLETQPDTLSDDIRGGMGTPHCTGLFDGGTPNITNTTIQVTQRKPPTYLDAMFSLGVFWDGRAGYCPSTNSVNGCFIDPDTGNVLIQGQIDSVTQKKIGGALEAQAVGPPVSSVEMACSDQTWPKIHQKLKTVVPMGLVQTAPQAMTDFVVAHHNSYPEMFQDAFGTDAKVNSTDSDDVINTRRIAYAIATHERRLTSDQTPWDKWNAGDNSAMSAQQIQGFSLFMGKGKCGVCHTPPMFTDFSFHFIGFHDPNVANNQDVTGLEKITGLATDKGKFKTPSLRNVGLREAGGLLHSGDGPGHDLNSVMTMYKSGGRRTETPILNLIDPQLVAVLLTTTEMSDIIEFLRNGLTDPRVKNETAPFDRPKLRSEP